MNRKLTYLTLGGILIVTGLFGVAARATTPRPEHPRPDLRRESWINLNGQWDFAFDPDEVGLEKGWFKPGSGTYDNQILVPFPWESPLSGIERPDYMGVAWYRREISVPGNWAGSRIFLVLGAVDWECTVWLDGKEIGKHVGGYTPVEVELTSSTASGKIHTLVVRVVDRTEHTQPVGKQVNWYTRTSGIWQTAYLESRGQVHIERCHFLPGPLDKRGAPSSGVVGHLKVDGGRPGDVISIQPAQDPEAGAEWAYPSMTHTIGEPISTILDSSPDVEVPIEMQPKDVRFWSPEAPNLYFVRVSIIRDGVMQDSVLTYFGARAVTARPLRAEGDNATKYEYIFLNGRPVYLRGALDQSFHPDGVYTWPSDAAIRYDLEKTKEYGLNFLRMHIKIEEPRFLYWADRMGVLLQCDLPSFWKWSDESKKNLETLYGRVVERDASHPSIFSWVLINETWGLEKHDTQESQDWMRGFYRDAKKIDPTRLIEDNSPCHYDHVETDINSWHFYIFDPDKAKKHIDDVVEKTFEGSGFNYIGDNKQTTAPMMNSEYGGVSAGSGDRDISWCIHYLTQLQRRHETICGYIYTELQDIEWEHNGIMNYDRTPKVFGYDEFVPLPADQPPFSVADIFGENFLGADLEPLQDCEPGQLLKIPVWLSRFDECATADVTFHGRLVGWNVHGERIEQNLIASGPASAPYPGVHDLGTLLLKVPDEPMMGVIGLWCETDTGVDTNVQDTGIGVGGSEILARGFATIQSLTKGEAPRTERATPTTFHRRWRPSDMLMRDASSPEFEEVLDGWKVSGTGALKLTYHVPIPQEVIDADILGLSFTAELGSRAGAGKVDWPSRAKKGDYPQTEPGKCWPSAVYVIVNGVYVDTIYLADDPADVRGVLSNLTNEHPSSYGELHKIGVRGDALKRVLGTLKTQKSLRLELAVQEDGPLCGGLSIYGERSGRYPIDPHFTFTTSDPIKIRE